VVNVGDVVGVNRELSYPLIAYDEYDTVPCGTARCCGAAPPLARQSPLHGRSLHSRLDDYDDDVANTRPHSERTVENAMHTGSAKAVTRDALSGGK
jgi:hypothetical protein